MSDIQENWLTQVLPLPSLIAKCLPQSALSFSSPPQPNPNLETAKGMDQCKWGYLHEPLPLNQQSHQTHFPGRTTLRKVLLKD